MLDKFIVCQNLDICLNQLDANRYLAVAVSLEHARYTQFISTSKIYCFENTETVMRYAVQILVNKDFRYLDNLNTFISRAKESGLILKWLNKNQRMYKERHEGYGQINMESFKITSMLWLGISFVPFLIFLVEIIVFRLAHKPNPTRICVLLEKLIDSERYFLLNDIRFK